MTHLREAVCRALADAGDPSRAVGQQAYMKSDLPYHGLTTPELRATVRPIFAPAVPTLTTPEALDDAVRGLWDNATHREQRYAAITLLRHRGVARHRTPDRLPLYRHLILTGAWWDYVDDIAIHLVRELVLAHPDVGAQMRDWAHEPDIWLRRTAIICQVGAGRGTDTDLVVAAVLPNLEGTETAGPMGRQDFFVRKGIGWMLRDYAYTDPDWVRTFVEQHRHAMSGLTIREATKHL